MLFNSYEFIFAFLPITFFVYNIFLKKWGNNAAFTALLVCSIVFYCNWKVDYIVLILGSCLGNYALGVGINRASDRWRNSVLFFGVSANLVLLGYFKYAAFLVENAALLAGQSWPIDHIELPLGISFFTFTQIAYLVDVRSGRAYAKTLLKYVLFVVFFPHLIAGPIIHCKELLPQFDKPIRERWQFISIGVLIFALGLFKKTIIADSLALYASPVFDTAAQGRVPAFFEAWIGALAYTFQLYFDFSAYSDMAIGIAALFGIRFPINFNSPYRARNIIEFWRHWHMTLSRFLRDYLYFPLGGNRLGPVRRHANLMATMLLGGLWHGADWKFLLWGGLHGGFLVVNHGWRYLRPKLSMRPVGRVEGLGGWAVTFLAVVIAWVPFRAADLSTAMSVMASMAGLHGVVLPNALATISNAFPMIFTKGQALDPALANWPKGVVVLALAGMVALTFPNIYQVLGTAAPVLDDEGRRMVRPLRRPWLSWSPSRSWGAVAAFFLVLGILGMSHVSEFLYFQF